MTDAVFKFGSDFSFVENRGCSDHDNTGNNLLSIGISEQ